MTCYNTPDKCCVAFRHLRFDSNAIHSWNQTAKVTTLQQSSAPKSPMTHVPRSERYPNQPAPFPPFFPRRHNWSYRMWPWLNTRSHFRINHALHELGINHGRNRCSVSIPQSDCNGIFISSTINNISTGARSLPRSVCLAARLAAYPLCYFKMFPSNDGGVALWD